MRIRVCVTGNHPIAHFQDRRTMEQSKIDFSEWHIDIVLNQVIHKPSQLIFEVKLEETGRAGSVICINAGLFIHRTPNAVDELPRILTEAKALFRFSAFNTQGC